MSPGDQITLEWYGIFGCMLATTLAFCTHSCVTSRKPFAALFLCLEFLISHHSEASRLSFFLLPCATEGSFRAGFTSRVKLRGILISAKQGRAAIISNGRISFPFARNSPEFWIHFGERSSLIRFRGKQRQRQRQATKHLLLLLHNTSWHRLAGVGLLDNYPTGGQI